MDTVQKQYEFKVGVFPGKFSPPHRGHITSIIEASTQCEKLYVVVSHHDKRDRELYDGTKTKPISFKQKMRWLSIELADFAHIKVVGLDESAIPVYPNGWPYWVELLNKAVGEKFDVIFGGEPEYGDGGYSTYYPDVTYRCYDKSQVYPISATIIRKEPYQHWDYILGPAREHYVKRVLLAGTESCGKTTLSKMLAKIFFTSWTREEGRYYASKYMGGNENVYEFEDFFKICQEQRTIDDHAIKTANKIVFMDTDAVATQFYCKIFMGSEYPRIESLIDPNRYDAVFFLPPDVKWIADGTRSNNEQDERWKLHNILLDMYKARGFGDKIIEISGGYRERLKKAVSISRELIP